jgi:ABC-type microcin C transport system permease subunit YejE
LSVRLCGIVKVIWLMRTARVTWIISVIQVFKFIRFVCVINAKRVIITLNEYAKASRSVRHQMSGNDSGMCVTCAYTS